MKKLIFMMAVAMVSVSFGAARAAAQGPQGSGAGSASSSSSSGTHSLNPIKWVKKEPKSASDTLDAKDEQDKKLTANLHAQGVLPANTDAKSACENFKALDECVAALHASKNVGLDFNCLKSNLTGVQTSADMSSCKGPAGDKSITLSKAIHAMKPDADAKAETKDRGEASQGRFEGRGRLVPQFWKTVTNLELRAQECEKGGLAGNCGARPFCFAGENRSSRLLTGSGAFRFGDFFLDARGERLDSLDVRGHGPHLPCPYSTCRWQTCRFCGCRV